MLGAILGGASLIGKIFGGAGQGAAQQRITENQQRLQQAQMQNQDALARGNFGLNSAAMDLQRRQFAQNEPGVQARQALAGSLLARIQPLQLSGLSPRVQARMPQMNSIIDAIGPEARQAGSLLSSRGLSGLESGPSTFDPLPTLPPAQIAALQKSGLLEKILGIGGLVGSTVGALGDLNSVGGSMNNAMPSNYTGMDRYGNAANFQLPRIELGDIHEGLG